MQKILLFLIIIGVNSCSTTNDFITGLVGVEKVEIDQSHYERPEIFVEKYKFSKNERSIASISSDKPDLTNRQLYFLTYYKQYLTIGRILKKENQIKSCPSFHHIYLEHQTQIEKATPEYSSKQDFDQVKKNIKNITRYPALSLPHEDGESLYTALVDHNWEEQQEHLKASLEHYYEIEKKEVEMLCDQGVSPGYYVFENLVNYFKDQQEFHRTHAGLKAVLKIPVMANMLILDNLTRDNFAMSEGNIFEYWLMDRSNLSWFKEYRENLMNKRQTMLSARMK